MAKKCNKRHDCMMRDIRNILKRNPELSKHFVESSYISKIGRAHV